jgi:hypothetical protein
MKSGTEEKNARGQLKKKRKLPNKKCKPDAVRDD